MDYIFGFVIGIYSFLHWFLVVSLLYSHFYKCCHEKWSKNWILWFFIISFACWLGISILIFIMWYCLKSFKLKQLQESRIELTMKKEEKNVENTKAVFFEKDKPEISSSSSENTNENLKEIIDLPNIDTKENFTVLQMNDHQPKESSVYCTEYPIPVDETDHYIQNESLQYVETESNYKPPKTPREIFFKDLIEAASKSTSYFDFDTNKISEEFNKKYELEKLKEKVNDGEQLAEENNFFMASHPEKKKETQNL